ncbi:MAG: hypothetical protein HY832_03225 [Candidatus Aenigmarchaeota archaeon]|nr:hypothetical protein [Candidatus Aenigmarchaeota archaeon]
MSSRFILLIAFVLAVSACTGTPTPVAQNGLAIHEFSADRTTVESLDPVRLYLDAENIGGTTAYCVVSELYGVDSWRDEYGQPLYVSSYPYYANGLSFNLDINGGQFNSLDVCYRSPLTSRPVGVCASINRDVDISLSGIFGTSFTQFAQQSCNQMESSPFRVTQQQLTPPLPERGKSGQSFIADWTLYPPILPEGLRQPYDITARTSYLYFTNAQVNIPVMTKDEYQRRENAKDPSTIVRTPIVQNTQNAPIVVRITRGSSPIVLNTASMLNRVERFNYRVELDNVGEGFPLPVNSGEGSFVVSSIHVSGPGVMFSDCGARSDWNTAVISSMLTSKNNYVFGCEIAVDKTQWVNKPLGTVSLNFELVYRYYIDRKITVTVVGAEGLRSAQKTGQ